MAGYGTDDGFTQWLAENGYDLPPNAPSKSVLRQRGSDYVDATYAHRLSCTSAAGGPDQERAWPRSGGSFPPDVIPSGWIRASYRAAYLEGSSPGSLSTVTNPNARVKRQKVDGAVEREFFDNGPASIGSGSGAVIDSIIDGLVGPYLCAPDDGQGVFLWSVGS